ncbi:MAG: leucine-rich repeat protein [Clostridia bacterium]|nr:leucine-rich repeat protein [Clostridia bacterium]
MKKIISILLALNMLGTYASASEKVSAVNKDGYVTVSGNDNLKDYSNTSPSPFTEDSENVNFVMAMTGVTGIGNNAFTYCAALGDAVLPSTVRYIGSQAFAGCTSLTSVIIPYGVTQIRNYAFADCKNLSSVYIPDTVTIIGESAFYGCDKLTIYAGEGSCARTYAQAEGIPIEYINGGQNQIIDVLNNVKIIINGNELSLKYPVVMKNNMTMIPLRTIFEAVGCTVTWNGAEQTAYASKNGESLGFRIGSAEVTSVSGPKQLDIPSALICGNTMVHIRAVEKLGMNVVWDGSQQTITITY